MGAFWGFFGAKNVALNFGAPKVTPVPRSRWVEVGQGERAAAEAEPIELKLRELCENFA